MCEEMPVLHWIKLSNNQQPITNEELLDVPHYWQIYKTGNFFIENSEPTTKYNFVPTKLIWQASYHQW